MAYFLRQVAPQNNEAPLIINIIGSEFIIGRQAVAELRNLMKISRRHAVFRRTRKGLLSIKDLDSMYGLYINSVKVDANLNHDLHPGDLIGLGVADERSIAHGFLGKLCTRLVPDVVAISNDNVVTISDDEDAPTSNANPKFSDIGLSDRKHTEVDILSDNCIATSSVTAQLNAIQLVDIKKDPFIITVADDITIRSETPERVDLEKETKFIPVTDNITIRSATPEMVDVEKETKFIPVIVDITTRSETPKLKIIELIDLTTVEQEGESSLDEVESSGRTDEKEAYSQENVETGEQSKDKRANSQENVSVPNESFPILASHIPQKTLENEKSNLPFEDRKSDSATSTPSHSGGLFRNVTTDNEHNNDNNLFSNIESNVYPLIYNISPELNESFNNQNIQNTSLPRNPVILNVYLPGQCDSGLTLNLVSTSAKIPSGSSDELENVALPKANGHVNEDSYLKDDGVVTKPRSKDLSKSNNDVGTPYQDVSREVVKTSFNSNHLDGPKSIKNIFLGKCSENRSEALNSELSVQESVENGNASVLNNVSPIEKAGCKPTDPRKRKRSPRRNISVHEEIKSTHHKSKVQKSDQKLSTESQTDVLELQQNVIFPPGSGRVCSKEVQTDFVQLQNDIALPEATKPKKRGRPRKVQLQNDVTLPEATKPRQRGRPKKVLTDPKFQPGQRLELCEKEETVAEKRKKAREIRALADKKKKASPPKKDDSNYLSKAKDKFSRLLPDLSKTARKSDVLNSKDSNTFLSSYRIPKKKNIGFQEEKKSGTKDLSSDLIITTQRDNVKTCLFTTGSSYTHSSAKKLNSNKSAATSSAKVIPKNKDFNIYKIKATERDSKITSHRVIPKQIQKNPTLKKSYTASTQAIPKYVVEKPNYNKINTSEIRKDKQLLKLLMRKF